MRWRYPVLEIVTGNEQTKEHNITDLIDYIQYNHFEVVDSKIYSIFDYLYKQYLRDRLKDRILGLYQIPLLRFKTNGSGEKEKIREALASLS